MAKLKIKPVNHGTTKADRNRYCGAAVVSAITGMTTGEAARLVRHLSGVRSVKGTSTRQIRDAFAACGVQFTPRSYGMRLNRTNGVTLAGWLKGTVKYRNAERVFLVVAGHHWQLVQGRRYVCGLTCEIVSIKDKRVKRRARVSEVYELTSPDGMVIPHVAKKPKNPNAGCDCIVRLGDWLRSWALRLRSSITILKVFADTGWAAMMRVTWITQSLVLLKLTLQTHGLRLLTHCRRLRIIRRRQ